MREYNIAVVGATGAVGETILSILESRHFPVKQIFPLASTRSAGEIITFKKKPYYIEEAAKFDFSKVDFALFSAGGQVSAQLAEKAAQAGAIVIDNTSHFRYEKDIPLVIPEVNPEAIAQYKNRGIIANPNCSTIQMLIALKPIHDEAYIERINVATYQSVSGTGRAAIEELAMQTADLLNGRPVKPKVYPYQIAFNVLPQIDDFQENGYTKEEMKMVWETQKILNDPNVCVNPTAVRVPVFYSHSEAVHIETREKITPERVRALLKKAPGVSLLDDPSKKKYPTPVTQASGQDNVFVGRIREDISHPRGLNLWIVGDNIRKGAALNAVQIAEYMIKNFPEAFRSDK